MSSSKQKAPRVSSVRVRLPVPDEENRSVTACSTPFYVSSARLFNLIIKSRNSRSVLVKASA